MSAPGRPRRATALCLGGMARSAKGAHNGAPGRPKRATALCLAGMARSAKGAV